MNKGLIDTTVRLIDEAMIPGSGVTKVQVSTDLYPLTEEDVREVERRFKATGFVASSERKGSSVAFVLEPFEIAGAPRT
jgi:hypothetical protein